MHCICDNMWCVQAHAWAYEHTLYIQEVVSNLGAELQKDFYARTCLNWNRVECFGGGVRESLWPGVSRRACELRLATNDLQPATCDLRPTTNDLRPATCEAQQPGLVLCLRRAAFSCRKRGGNARHFFSRGGPTVRRAGTLPAERSAFFTKKRTERSPIFFSGLFVGRRNWRQHCEK